MELTIMSVVNYILSIIFECMCVCTISMYVLGLVY